LDYDPMLSKLIVHAPDRASAVARMRRVLDEYSIGGIKTNLPLFRRILEHPDFLSGCIDTGFLDRLLAVKPVSTGDNGLSEIAAIAAALFAATASPSTSGANLRRQDDQRKIDGQAWKRAARVEATQPR